MSASSALTMQGLETCPLEESAALLRFTLHAAQAGSWAWDVVTGEAFWSEGYHHLTGTSPETCQPSYKNWLRLIHPADQERAAGEMRAALEARREIDIEFRILRTDGAVRWVNSKGQTLYGEGGAPLRMVGVTFDITERKLTEEALQRHQDELRIIADGVPALISYVDTEQRYQFNNKIYEEWFGHSREEIRGRPVREILGERAYEEVRPHIEAALAGREARFELRLDYQGAGCRWIEARYVPHLDRQGEVCGFFALIHDVTARKQAEVALVESNERFRTAVENMIDCFGIYSAVRDGSGKIADFRIEYVNAAACDHNLMQRQEQIGKLLCEVLPSHRESGLFDEYCAVVETGEPLIRETVAYEDNYNKLYLKRSFDIRAAKLGDGFIAVWRDVTERKRTEQAARESEERARAQAAELTALMAVLRESDQRKDEFLAMLAHELRNPLAPVRNAVEAMRRLVPPGSQLQQMREVIERQTDQLTRLVDDLLDVARISQGKVTLRREKVDLLTVVGRAVEISRPLIDTGGHRLTVSLPPEAPQLEGDLTRLAQVISNLLNNAAKYTERGGNIWLTAESQGGEILLRVKDSGIGIPAEVLPRVFDLFAQADRGLDRAQGGLGIGLTLVKNIVELHGGTVRAFSAGPGQGSEFVVHLPVLAEPAYRAEAASFSVADERKSAAVRRVLVVDDNVDSADSMALLLRMEGQDVRTAYDGSGAIEAAGTFQPHVVLLDIGLPGMDGHEVAVHLRERLEMRKTVLIALTGYGQQEDRQRSLDTGFDHHLTKPVDYEALRALIHTLAAD